MNKSIFITALAAVLAFFFATQSGHARVIVKERTTYYTVTGKTGAALFKSISRRGPRLGRSRHAIATTTSNIQVRNLKTKVRRGRCVVQSVNVVLNLTYRYPRWRNQRGASPRVRRAWKKFMARARKHELTHGRISKEHARQIDRTVRGFKGRVSRKCNDFAKGAKRKFARLNRQANRKHERFDRREASVRSRSTRLQIALYKAR